ncbi:DUF6449 domain-containing protein [Bacillus sp. SG-1]|uniref:DUF6449 domain-containing protein n=1 Tax=Bacillus sp. SG-1 TaxID=161544 RepID=UPI00015437C4|nr:DUF6449 domain-containing protein [Bacillus sp. SG-1]EDL65849.1 hypothetical protein BSG1_16375 [Bacillus sp. SG-1]
MQSSKSLVNKEIMTLIGRNTGWIGIVYFAGLIFALPLNVWMMLTSEEPSYLLTYGQMFQINFVLQAGLMMVIPVLLSIFSFRFLHVKQQADMIHSLPIRRKKLFMHFSAAGIIMLILPVVFTAMIMVFLTLTNDLGSHFQADDIISWALVTILMVVLFYVCGITVAMITGLSVVQAVLTYVLLLFPSGMYILSVLNIKNFLFGFPEEYYLAVRSEDFSPIIKAGLFNEVQLSFTEIIIYVFLIFVFWILALVLYKRRKIETTSQTFAFPVLQPVFKFGLIIGVMLVSGGYFSAVQKTLPWTLFGYGVGFAVGYLLSEMIVQKTWRIGLRLKEMAIFAFFLTGIAVFIHFGFKNYESYVPDLNEIERIYFNDHIYSYLEEYEEEPVRYLSNEENIRNVKDLHGAIISDKESKGSVQLYIVYELKAGKKVIRNYEIDRTHFDFYYESIYESVEYKESAHQILSVDTHLADKLTITARGPQDKQVSITDESLLEEAIDKLKKEVLEESYESMVDRSETLYDIEILLANEQRLYVPWKPSYSNFETWLMEKDLFNQVKVLPEDVSKILIYKREDHQTPLGMEVDLHDSIATLEEDNKALRITSEQKVKDLLEMKSWTIESEYMAAFYFKGQDYPHVKGIKAENIPDYIMDHFER